MNLVHLFNSGLKFLDERLQAAKVKTVLDDAGGFDRLQTTFYLYDKDMGLDEAFICDLFLQAFDDLSAQIEPYGMLLESRLLFLVDGSKKVFNFTHCKFPVLCSAWYDITNQRGTFKIELDIRKAKD
jgi:hypothetical protein